VCIEVKGTDAGIVRLSKAQVNAAKEERENFVLAVVVDGRIQNVFIDPIRMWQSGQLDCAWLIRV
jgi:hypothetical protein